MSKATTDDLITAAEQIRHVITSHEEDLISDSEHTDQLRRALEWMNREIDRRHIHAIARIKKISHRDARQVYESLRENGEIQ